MSSNRVLALDVGTVRIGVAVTDPLCLFAQGVGVWNVKPEEPSRETPRLPPLRFEGWRGAFEECLARYDPRLILIGLPLRTNGQSGPEAERVEILVLELRGLYPERRFQPWDERYTTVLAERVLLEADVSRKKRKNHVDKIAAVLILQSWLRQGDNF